MLEKIKKAVKLRGVGWVVVYYDKEISELKKGKEPSDNLFISNATPMTRNF